MVSAMILFTPPSTPSRLIPRISGPIWTITLNNQSGAQQTDYFAQFSLQDPLGNTYEGTGELNADFFLSAGQTVFKTEIFSFLPRPGVSYTLVARFGISGITYDPLQFTF